MLRLLDALSVWTTLLPALTVVPVVVAASVVAEVADVVAAVVVSVTVADVVVAVADVVASATVADVVVAVEEAPTVVASATTRARSRPLTKRENVLG